MLKKISVVALAGLLSLPVAALAGGVEPSAAELQQQIEKLTRELGQLRQQMQDLKGQPAPAMAPATSDAGLRREMEQIKAQNEETAQDVAALKDKSESWDLASRIQWDGDFRSRIDYSTADTPSYYNALDIGKGVADFYQLNTDFGAAFGALAPAEQGAFAGMIVGDLFAAAGPDMQLGTADDAPFGTADVTALTALGTIVSSLSPQQQGAFMTFLQTGGVVNNAAVLTLGDIATGFNAALGDNTQLAPVIGFMKTLSPAERVAIFNALGYSPRASNTYYNDTLWTNRLRLNMRVKATENVSFKGRLAMYKAWGMLNNPVDYTFNNGQGGGPYLLSSLSFDGSSTRQPQDNVLRVDRAYVNWTNIGDQPIWFSIGRRPTTDGPPAHLRQGLDERMATPTAFMDYPFDGLTLGYAYDGFFGIQDFPGRIRFCYGRGFEAGPTDNSNPLRDVDFAGISWDVYNKGSRFFGFQAFEAFDMFNVPDNVDFPNPVEFANYLLGNITFDPTDPNRDLLLGRTNLGNIYHTTAVYMDKYSNLNYFLAAGWSRTDPQSIDELGTGLLSSFNTSDANLESEDGYAIYAGLRFDIPDHRLKLGLEYNYGSQYWIGFTPGHDDLTQAKLATRGHVAEAYMIYNLPAGEKLSKYADFFMRLGYQHYMFDYTGSGFWLGEPIDIDDAAKDPLNAQFNVPIDTLDQVYLSLDTYF